MNVVAYSACPIYRVANKDFPEDKELTSCTLSADTRKALEQISTATIFTTLFKRGLKNQYIQNVQPLDVKDRNMVGPAFTLRYIPAREDLNPITVFNDSNHPQRVAVEQCPAGNVMVVDSRKNARAASAGAILITRLMVRGVTGFVTDGGLRDAREIANLDIACYHQRPSAPTNLTQHQAIEVNGPIGCGDAAVFPGDIIVGDFDGVVVIPAEIAEEITLEATDMTQFEKYVAERVLAGDTIIGLYPPTSDTVKSDFQKWCDTKKE